MGFYLANSIEVYVKSFYMKYISSQTLRDEYQHVRSSLNNIIELINNTLTWRQKFLTFLRLNKIGKIFVYIRPIFRYAFSSLKLLKKTRSSSVSACRWHPSNNIHESHVRIRKVLSRKRKWPVHLCALPAIVPPLSVNPYLFLSRFLLHLTSL